MERRNYNRMVLEIKSLFFLVEDEFSKTEFTAVITNISEAGFEIKLTGMDRDRVVEKVQEGSLLKCVIMDEEHPLIREELRLFQTEAVVVRFSDEDEILRLGCKVSEKEADFRSYVENSKYALLLRKNG